MSSERSDDRFLRLERALLGHRGHGVTFDPVGDIDVAALRREMGRLGFELVACDEQGFAYAAEFRRPGRQGGHAVHGAATSFSRQNAIVEAAIAALDGDTRAAPARPMRPGFTPALVGPAPT